MFSYGSRRPVGPWSVAMLALVALVASLGAVSCGGRTIAWASAALSMPVSMRDHERGPGRQDGYVRHRRDPALHRRGAAESRRSRDHHQHHGWRLHHGREHPARRQYSRMQYGRCHHGGADERERQPGAPVDRSLEFLLGRLHTDHDGHAGHREHRWPRGVGRQHDGHRREPEARRRPDHDQGRVRPGRR